MRKLKSITFMAAVTVLMMSFGSLPTALAQSQPSPGTLTVVHFCLVGVQNELTTFGDVISGQQNVQGSFDLQQDPIATGDSVLTIQSNGWEKDPGPGALIAAADTYFGFNAAATTAFDNTQQALGTVAPNAPADTVNLEFDVNLVAGEEDYLGNGLWPMTLSETCNAP